jgi:hypothetical protein
MEHPRRMRVGITLPPRWIHFVIEIFHPVRFAGHNFPFTHATTVQSTSSFAVIAVPTIRIAEQRQLHDAMWPWWALVRLVLDPCCRCVVVRGNAAGIGFLADSRFKENP